MRSARSPFVLLFLGVAFSLWEPLHSMSATYQHWCVALPNTSKQCRQPEERFFHDINSKTCQPFFGCPGNDNNYSTLGKCQLFCILSGKSGQCPRGPPAKMPMCHKMCQDDWDCPKRQKCCRYGCKTDCKDPA